jgi:hypothetical protein
LKLYREVLYIMLSLSEASDKLIGFVRGGGKYDECGIYLHEHEVKGGVDTIDFSTKATKKDVTIEPILNSRTAYIAGAAGSGKSTLAAKMLKSYKKQHPSHKIYGLSCCMLADDPAFEDIKILQIDTKLLPLDINEFSNCMFLFDDIESFPDMKIQNACYNLIEQILQNGRKKNISAIITCHLLNPNNHKFGRVLMNEIQQMTIFPRGSNTHAINYCLQKYFGLNRLQIDDILTSKSRSVTICKTYPSYIMEEKVVRML